MSGRQGDLFSGGGFPASQDAPPGAKRPTVAWHALAGEKLISVLSDADMAGSLAVIGEIGRRKLVEAIPALEQLCQRFRGFGLDRIVPEQAAAFDALVMIGGREAAQAVARQIVGGRGARPRPEESRQGCGRSRRCRPRCIGCHRPSLCGEDGRCAPRSEMIGRVAGVP